MSWLKPGDAGTNGSIDLFNSNGLLGAAIKAGAVAASFILNADVVGIFGPAIATTLQVRNRFRQRWFPPRRRDSAVAAALARLPESYIVVEDVPLPRGKGNLDYFVIGPDALFAIESSDFAGELKCEGYECYVNRRRVPSLCRHAKNKAAAVRNSLAELSARREEVPAVQALVVLSNPGATAKLHQPAVPVLRLEELVEYIQDYNPTHDAARRSIEEMRAMARHLHALSPKPAASRFLNFLRLS